MRRLYLQVYAAFVGIVVLLSVAAAVAAGVFGPRTRHDARLLQGMATLASEFVPPPAAGDTQERLRRLSERLGLALAIYAPDGATIASTGVGLPAPRPGWTSSRWVALRGPGHGVALRLDDGRWLMAGTRVNRAAHLLGGAVGLALIAVLIAVGAYPVARRITRRIERLQQRVDALGSGDLKARVEVEGRDEVADLARSFNRAAERIERLLGAQRGMLAGASHELRSPLARIRVGVELLADKAPPELARRMALDVEELDELVSELLLASRLEVLPHPERVEDVDLLALVAEECARVEAEVEVEGTPELVAGDARMLRRMVRNLLDNAARYGGGTPVEASVTAHGGRVLVRVADRGPGVPEAERERIFEPFYRPAGWREGPEGGVGLGLALVRQIARHHGGDARWVAREGRGSCFEVWLPRKKPSAISFQPAPNAGRS
jgi:signal transduction histidine kinase